MANATMDKKQWNKKRMYQLLIIAILLVVLIFFGKCVQETLTDTHGVFFLEYDSKQRVTRIYEYSSEYNEPIIIATVDGWYHSAKIDKNKEYVIGFRGSQFEVTASPAEVVRVSAQNGTSEVYLSNAEIHNIIGNTFSSWDSTEALIDDEGEKIFFGRKRVLYERKSNKIHDVEAIFEEKGISVSDFCELQDETLWVANKEGDILEYNFETEELVKVLSDIPGKVSVFDKEKIAYVCGYLTYEEAMEGSLQNSLILQKQFSSWEEMLNSYMLGYQFWKNDPCVSEDSPTMKRWDCCEELMAMEGGPYTLDWDMKLEKCW